MVLPSLKKAHNILVLIPSKSHFKDKYLCFCVLSPSRPRLNSAQYDQAKTSTAKWTKTLQLLARLETIH